MVINIKRHVDYVVEALELLIRYTNHEKYTELKHSLMNKYTFTDDQVEDNLNKVISFSDYVYKHMEIKEDRLDFFFHKMKEGNLCLATGILLIHPDFITDGFEQRIQLINAMNRNELFARMISIYTEHDWIESEESKKTGNSLEEQLKLIEELEMPLDDKWKLERAILHYDIYFEELILILKKVIELIKNCDEITSGLIDHCCIYWESYLKSNTIEAFIEKSLNINIGRNIEEVYIIPAIAGCNSINFNMSEIRESKSSHKNCLYMYAGILFDDSFNNNKKPIEQTQVYNTLKILGDKSKIDILLYIKDKSAYGQELAALLGLTTATISHHMTALLSAGLVNVNRDSNRIYYTMNKENLTEFLKTVQHVFLEP